MAQPKKLLMIAYYFPPQSSVGAHRTTRFLKHFSANGLAAEVITVANPDPQFCPLDANAIPTDIYCDVPVHRVQARNVKPYWQIPTALLARLGKLVGREVNQERIAEQFWRVDMHWGFVTPARDCAIKLAAGGGYDAIYVSCPPHSAAIAAHEAAHATGLPFILDFRDSWVASPYARPKTLSYDGLEREMLAACSALIVNTPDDVKLYEGRIAPEKIHFIPNGFDKPFCGPFAPAVQKPDEPLSLLYLGAWDGRARNPALLLDALKDRAEPWQLISHGNANDILVEAAKVRGLEDKVFANGFVAKEQIEDVLQGVDALVLLQGAPAPGMINTHIAAKTFDYMATGKPILALAAAGANRDFLARYPTHAILADPADVADVQTALDDLFARHALGQLPHVPDEDFLAAYSGAALTQKLAQVVAAITSRSTK